MKIIKSFLFLLITSVYIFCLSSSALAGNGEINFEKWNKIPEIHVITTEETHSNSALTAAFLKVTDNAASNRLIILFALNFSSFTDLNNVGIIMKVNGGEEIVIHADNTAEYNEDKYFVSNTTYVSEEASTVYMQTVLGIKNGIPDKQILTLQARDSEGILSNRYTVDISENVSGDSTDTTQEQTSVSTNKKNPTEKTRKTAKSNKTDKNNSSAAQSSLISVTEESVTVGYTEKVNNKVTLGTGKVVGGTMGIFVLILSAGFGLSHLIKSKQQKRGEG